MMKTTIYAALLMTMIVSVSIKSFGQTRTGKTYRVIAYKKGDLSVLSVSNETVIIPSMTLYIPNTFTPNGDGINDTFGINGEAVKEFNLVIYNRWGDLIFQSDQFDKRWDGTYKGKKVPCGSYVYKVMASGPTGNKETSEGNVNVIM